MVSSRVDSQSTFVEMTSISTPTALQAESYISTVALFLLFSQSSKENKAYMKLPATWRDLWSEFVEIRKAREDEVDKKLLMKIQKYVRGNMSRFADDVFVAENFQKINVIGDLHKRNIANQEMDAVQTVKYLPQLWTGRASTASFKQMKTARMRLPIWKFRKNILETIAMHQVAIICSETGSGKSTQIPSFILESELLSCRSCKIYVTEPRRISAMSLARRVSEELGEARDDLGTSRSLVGYAVRLESKASSSTRLIFAWVDDPICHSLR
jgi:ATP-dependent RNA helicase DHX29